jgi:DNA-binding CsgD family transcriptional regulator
MTVKGGTTDLAPNVAIVAVKLREGKTKRQICEEMDITRQTLAKYLKAHLADELKAITQEELQLHLRIELERCDELEDRIEAGTMTDAKRIQLLLSVVKHRCELLGLFPKETIVLAPNTSSYKPPVINIILQDDGCEYQKMEPGDTRMADLSNNDGRFVRVPKRLQAAPVADAEVIE